MSSRRHGLMAFEPLNTEETMKKDDVLRRVAELPNLPYASLKQQWRDLFGTEPPNYSAPMMVRRLAWRIQEIAYGGLTDWATNELAERVKGERLDADGPGAARKARKKRRTSLPAPGTRLVREWEGERHEVTVLRGGRLEYEGRAFRSLTSVAYAITGGHRNGPRFFGLREMAS